MKHLLNADAVKRKESGFSFSLTATVIADRTKDVHDVDSLFSHVVYKAR